MKCPAKLFHLRRDLDSIKKTRRLTLPEPEAVIEIHAVRRRIQRRAEKIGWAKYLKEINPRPSLMTEPAPLVLRKRPAKDYGSR